MSNRKIPNGSYVLFAFAVVIVLVVMHMIPDAEAGNSEARKQAKAQSEAIAKGIKANADLRGSSGDNRESTGGTKPTYGSGGNSGVPTGGTKPTYGCPLNPACATAKKSSGNTGVKASTGKCNSNYGWLSVSLPNRWHQALIWIDGNYVGNKQASVQVVAGYHTVYVQYYGSSGFSYDETTRGYVPACKSWSINSS